MGSRPHIRWNGNQNCWEVSGSGGAKIISFGGDYITKGKEDHLYLDTSLPTKTVRINSRNYTATASIIGFQSKPRASVNMKDDIIGGELQPGINAGFWGKGIVGLKIDTSIKATTGSLAGEVRCYEAAIGADSGYAGPVAGPAYCYGLVNNMHGTVTKGVYGFYAKTAGGNRAWNGLFALPDDSQLAHVGSASNAPDAYMYGLIGSTNVVILCKTL